MKRRQQRLLAALLAAAGLALLLLAPPLEAAVAEVEEVDLVEAQVGEEAHGDDHGAGGAWSPFEGDVGNALWTVLIFLIVLFVLGKYAWTPILGGLQAREQFIRDSLETAKRDRDAAEARLAEYEAKLAGARGEVDEMLDEARRDASALRQREEAAAREEADRMLERAKREISIAQETAVQELYTKAAQLSTAVAGRILEREIRPEDHDRLIREAIDSVERMETH